MTNSLKIPKNQVRTRNSIEQAEHEDSLDARRVTLIDPLSGEPYDSNNPIPVSATINVSPGAGLDTPIIANVSAPLANIEYSYAIPAGTGKIIIKSRPQDAIIKYAWTSGQSGTQYMSIGYGVTKEITDISLNGKTLYFQVSKPGYVLEIETWS